MTANTNTTTAAPTITLTLDSVIDRVPTVVPHGSCNLNPTVLRIKGTTFRHGVCVTPAGEFARREFGGPILEGPFAATFGLCSVIDNSSPAHKLAERAREEAVTIEVETGSRLRIDGSTYEVSVFRREYINLTLVG